MTASEQPQTDRQPDSVAGEEDPGAALDETGSPESPADAATGRSQPPRCSSSLSPRPAGEEVNPHGPDQSAQKAAP
jgi:hypothetical protein